MGDVLSFSKNMTETRELPANIEIEQACIGAIIVNNEAYYRVSDFLKPEHFSEELHQRIFSVCQELINAGKVASPATLKTWLGDINLGEETYKEIPISHYIARLAAQATTIINARDFARTIADLAARRNMIVAADGLADYARNMPISAAPEDVAAQAISDLEVIVGGNRAQDTRIDPHVSAGRLIEHAKAIIAGEIESEAVMTGLPDLDRQTGGGFCPGDLWIIGGRPGMGKTTLATGFAKKIAQRGARDAAGGKQAAGVILFELEVAERQTMARFLADIAYSPREEISFGQILRSELTESQIWALEEAQERLDRIPLAIDIASRLTIAEIKARIRAEKKRMIARGFQLRVAIIDYLKFIKASDRYRGQRVYEVGEISGSLKEIAKDEQMCIVLCAQLNRLVAAHDRKDKRPTLVDLRESGDLEADADVVLFVHREAYYIKQSAEYNAGDFDATADYERLKYEAELILGKCRAGDPQIIKVWMNIACSTFASAARSGI